MTYHHAFIALLFSTSINYSFWDMFPKALSPRFQINTVMFWGSVNNQTTAFLLSPRDLKQMTCFHSLPSAIKAQKDRKHSRCTLWLFSCRESQMLQKKPQQNDFSSHFCTNIWQIINTFHKYNRKRYKNWLSCIKWINNTVRACQVLACGNTCEFLFSKGENNEL